MKYQFSLFGPSHVNRIQKYLNDQILVVNETYFLFGIAGAPVWNLDFSQKIDELSSSCQRLVVMVGDFRFGNSIIEDIKGGSHQELVNNYIGINKKYLDAESSLILKEKCMNAIQKLEERHTGKIYFLFWDLAFRQVLDRLDGKYITNGGKYNHPFFNYSSDVNSVLKTSDHLIDIEYILSISMHKARRLIIDRSCHPSWIGCNFILNLLRGINAKESLDSAFAQFDNLAALWIRMLQEGKGSAKALILTGRSEWLLSLLRYLDADHIKFMLDNDIYIIPSDRTSWGHLSTIFNFAIKSIKDLIEHSYLCIFSYKNKTVAKDLLTLFQIPSLKPKSIACIDWDYSASQIVESRGETPNLQICNEETPEYEDRCRLELDDKCVEYGPQMTPTIEGIDRVIAAIQKHFWCPHKPSLKDEFVINKDVIELSDVVVNKRDRLAFLTGGRHSVLAFSTGKLIPSETSIRHFRDNIKYRTRHCSALNCSYLHVIFPDKQFVASNFWPYRELVSPADRYTNDIESHGVPSTSILYLRETLAKANNLTFYRMDSHINDLGIILSCEKMLDCIGYQSSEALKTYKKQPVSMVMRAGDLGSKVQPKCSELEQQRLFCDMPIAKFAMPASFNDGFIGILLSPEAQYKHTLLIFGDSFFNQCLDFFGIIFWRVIFVRSRFFYPDLAKAIAPEVIFTGNAERYFSSVQSDLDAPSFFPALLRRGSEINFQPLSPFWNVLDALMRPDHPKTNAYLNSVIKKSLNTHHIKD